MESRYYFAGLIGRWLSFAESQNLSARKEVRGVALVIVNEGESIESALRRFKRRVQSEDIIRDYKKHTFYLKPGEKRRLKSALARKRNRKKARRNEM
ncbi:ribosomal protein S21 [Pyrinomonas methylaliphatogenes]|jgi:small subunit ribosomal protein S21|uniref:Small ribosomal subunit protein bS21 n=1 Tax=Pyrinomonas methylaliphatogenes TaxID=454194 RepID=A0A0B6WZ81_9BACT|nr:ribosomal protein S21 [Pyrinomonas methylaliphatogenes]